MPKIPLDWNHATESWIGDAHHAAAAGWIVARQYGPNGVWGKVEWTKRGAESVAEHEVRYISPVLMLNAANEVLKSAALTNTPNLKRKAINSVVKGGGEMKAQKYPLPVKGRMKKRGCKKRKQPSPSPSHDSPATSGG